MVLDTDIRSRTNNEKSLDDLMKWLYAKFLRTDKLYNTDDIINGIKITTSLDYTKFYNKYIYDTEVIPVSKYFDPGKALWNLKWNKKEMPKHEYYYRTLGIKKQNNNQNHE